MPFVFFDRNGHRLGSHPGSACSDSQDSNWRQSGAKPHRSLPKPTDFVVIDGLVIGAGHFDNDHLVYPDRDRALLHPDGLGD